jgi:hypothetical protein
VLVDGEDNKWQEKPPELVVVWAKERLDRCTGGDELSHWQYVETKEHDEDRASQREEDLLWETLKFLFLKRCRHKACHQYGSDECKDGEDNNLAESYVLSGVGTAKERGVVRKLKRNEERKVEADNDIDDRLSSADDAVHQKETKDTKKIGDLLNEQNDVTGVHVSLL